ncbi:hypothetical protein Dsin_015969 [Dipteronia sinensis]|uniref:Uncharacterized protein n=1 Tax=Dipteronia sinensis TaxID=43782 RepID=A0AAE0ACY9_9ROSI|nr:hypothetical protein Dsin_015969 [Dipteronia sinensis]
MATYQLEFRQNNEILNRNFNWLNTNFCGFVIELNVHHHRNNGELLRATNRTYYQENHIFFSERGMREFLTRILLAEHMFVNSSRFLCDHIVQLIRHRPSGDEKGLVVDSVALVCKGVVSAEIAEAKAIMAGLSMAVEAVFTHLTCNQVAHAQGLSQDYVLEGTVN